MINIELCCKTVESVNSDFLRLKQMCGCFCFVAIIKKLFNKNSEKLSELITFKRILFKVIINILIKELSVLAVYLFTVVILGLLTYF